MESLVHNFQVNHYQWDLTVVLHTYTLEISKRLMVIVMTKTRIKRLILNYGAEMMVKGQIGQWRGIKLRNIFSLLYMVKLPGFMI